jgi:hypothetical protein
MYRAWNHEEREPQGKDHLGVAKYFNDRMEHMARMVAHPIAAM